MAPSVLQLNEQQFSNTTVRKQKPETSCGSASNLEKADSTAVYMFYECPQDAIEGKQRRLQYLSKQGFTCDQDWPVDVMHLCTQEARESDEPPVLLIGGMGPAAGFEAFDHLVRTLGSSREILLFQACFTPDRTRAVAGLESREEVVTCLRNSIIFASKLFTCPEEKKLVMVSCNTAHIFFTEALLSAEEMDPTLDLTHVSLIDSTVSAVARLDDPVMLLSTAGTRANRLYSDRLESAGVDFMEPDESGQEMLNRLIVDGIKGGNLEVVSKIGGCFINNLFNNRSSVSPMYVIGGCTEIPIIFECLARSDDDYVAAMARQVIVINPFHEATTRLTSLEVRDSVSISTRDIESRPLDWMRNGRTYCTRKISSSRLPQRRNTTPAVMGVRSHS